MDKNDTMNKHLIRHGDGVRDVAFEVEDCRAIYERTQKGGAETLLPPT